MASCPVLGEPPDFEVTQLDFLHPVKIDEEELDSPNPPSSLWNPFGSQEQQNGRQPVHNELSSFRLKSWS